MESEQPADLIEWQQNLKDDIQQLTEAVRSMESTMEYMGQQVEDLWNTIGVNNPTVADNLSDFLEKVIDNY